MDPSSQIHFLLKNINMKCDDCCKKNVEIFSGVYFQRITVRNKMKMPVKLTVFVS